LKTILYLVSRQQVSHTLLTSITRVGSQFFKNEFVILFHELFGAKILCSDHIGCTDDLHAAPDPKWDQTALQAARIEEKRRKLQRDVISQHNAAYAELVHGNEDGTDDPFLASVATMEVLDALSNRTFHPNMKRTLNASVEVDVFTMCDNGVILSAASDNVQEWKEEMKIVARIGNEFGKNDTPMNLTLPKHVNSLDTAEKEQILEDFELGKDANKEARRSLFADEEKARKADARRAAREEKARKAEMADARRVARVAREEAEKAERAALAREEECWRQFHIKNGQNKKARDAAERILKKAEVALTRYKKLKEAETLQYVTRDDMKSLLAYIISLCPVDEHDKLTKYTTVEKMRERLGLPLKGGLHCKEKCLSIHFPDRWKEKWLARITFQGTRNYNHASASNFKII